MGLWSRLVILSGYSLGTSYSISIGVPVEGTLPGQEQGQDRLQTLGCCFLLFACNIFNQNYFSQGFLVVQWLILYSSNAGHTGSVAGQGAKIPTSKSNKLINFKNYCLKKMNTFLTLAFLKLISLLAFLLCMEISVTVIQIQTPGLFFFSFITPYICNSVKFFLSVSQVPPLLCLGPFLSTRLYTVIKISHLISLVLFFPLSNQLACICSQIRTSLFCLRTSERLPTGFTINLFPQSGTSPQLQIQCFLLWFLLCYHLIDLEHLSQLIWHFPQPQEPFPLFHWPP